MIIYMDESGGLDPGHRDVFVVAGVAIDPQIAKRVLKRFRKQTRWQNEIKGADLPENYQEYLLRGALASGSCSAVAVALDAGMPRCHSAYGLACEHGLYAAMVAELLCSPTMTAHSAMRTVADGGRYTGTIMQQLPAAIRACQVRIAGALPGGAPVVEFHESHGMPGLQIADVLANYTFRHYRNARCFGSPAGTIAQASGVNPAAPTARVDVHACQLAGLALPAWVQNLHPGVPAVGGLLL